jgi:hypothetical protein
VLRLDQDRTGRDHCADRLEACSPHCLARLDEVDDSVGNAQGARGLDTATHVLDVGFELRILCVTVGGAALLGLQLSEVSLGQVREAGDYVLADEVLGLGQVALLRDLDLQTALSKVEVEHLDDAGCGCGRHAAFVLLDLVAACDAQVDAALADEGGDVGGWQEDEGERQILDKRDVKARMAVELDVRAVEEVEADLVKTALCLESDVSKHWGLAVLLLGTAKSSRSFKLLPSVSVMNGKLRLPWRALCMMYSISFAPFSPFA